MKAQEIIFQNKYAQIVSKGYCYVVQSKKGSYNDVYFLTSSEAYRYLGMIPPSDKFTFNK
jgi:hypothetical protein